MTDKPAPTPLLAPLVLPPNFRDVTAERIGTVFAIIGATAAQGTAAVSFADAGADPATLGLRRAFHSALAMRLRMLKAKLRMAVIQHDLLGLGGTNIAAMVQRDADRLAAFDRWLGITTSQVMSGIWLEAAVTRAWIAGRENATSTVAQPSMRLRQRVLPRALELNWQASRARWPMSYYGSLKVPWSPT